MVALNPMVIETIFDGHNLTMIENFETIIDFFGATINFFQSINQWWTSTHYKLNDWKFSSNAQKLSRQWSKIIFKQWLKNFNHLNLATEILQLPIVVGLSKLTWYSIFVSVITLTLIRTRWFLCWSWHKGWNWCNKKICTHFYGYCLTYN